ncbi:MAG: hypothetical protein ACLTZT_21025 [Butyricimonas faecalis]
MGTDKTLNIGVETELFNRLSFMLEYYDKRSYDLLGNVQIDPTLGFDGDMLMLPICVIGELKCS